MGKRSRRRGDEPVRAAATAPKKPDTWTDRFVAASEQRPKAPWHPVPLVEICVLAGIVLIVVGFMDFENREGRILLALGLVLASLAGLDTAVRDHFAGFRSHTLLLAGVPCVLAAGGLFYLGVPWPVVMGAALVALIGGAYFFATQFRKRSGGRTIKL